MYKWLRLGICHALGWLSDPRLPILTEILNNIYIYLVVYIWTLENRHDVHSETYHNLYHNNISLDTPSFCFILLHISQQKQYNHVFIGWSWEHWYLMACIMTLHSLLLRNGGMFVISSYIQYWCWLHSTCDVS